MVGHYSEGTRNDGTNGAGLGRNVQGGGAVGAVVWQQDLGGYRGDNQGPDGIPPLGGMTDHGDDVKTGGRRRVEVPSVTGGDGRHRDAPHRGANQEAEYDHSGEGGLTPHICTL